MQNPAGRRNTIIQTGAEPNHKAGCGADDKTCRQPFPYRQHKAKHHRWNGKDPPWKAANAFCDQ